MHNLASQQSLGRVPAFLTSSVLSEFLLKTQYAMYLFRKKKNSVATLSVGLIHVLPQAILITSVQFQTYNPIPGPSPELSPCFYTSCHGDGWDPVRYAVETVKSDSVHNLSLGFVTWNRASLGGSVMEISRFVTIWFLTMSFVTVRFVIIWFVTLLFVNILFVVVLCAVFQWLTYHVSFQRVPGSVPAPNRWYAVKYSAVQHGEVHGNTVKWSTLQYTTIKYSTVHFN